MVERERVHNREIIDSLNYAKLIQQALLPSHKTMKKLLGDYFTLFMPKDVVSGDFFWAALKNRQTYIVAADCTGHGVPGALMSILGISFLNDVVRTDCSHMANRILNRLREKVMEALHQTGNFNESKDGMDLSMCIIDHDKSSLQYSGANNPLYIIRNNKLHEIKADKMPVGINAVDEETFSNNSVKIRKNDRIYMFSDGYPDQFGGPKGKKFKYRPFKQLLLDIHRKNMSDQHSVLYDTIVNWMGNNEQIDDILVLGFIIS
ncbi:MAG: SpoIIE family protein phosphatase [Bacteroidales bacterium]